MGDGGVACMHMDRFPIPSEKTIYASKSNGNGFRPKSLVNLGDAEGKKRMKVKAEVLASKKADSEKSEFALDKVGNSSASVGENGENGADDAGKEEVEEGELGTLKWPRSEVESGEFIRDKWRRSEIEKGDRWRKGEIAKGELSSSIGKWRRRDAADKGEFGSWRDESDREDYVPDRWQKVEADKDDYYNNKMLRYETGKEKRWNFEHERTPPSGKYLTDDILGRKKLNRSVNQHAKPRWESGQERSIRISSKIVDDEGSYNIKNDYNKKNEYRNGKYLGREYSTDNRLKRYGTDSDKNERRHHGDYTGLKSRRLSDENSIRSGHSVERSYRNSSSSRLSPPDKYSSRHYTSSLSSKLAYERHGPSPAHSERSPRERARYYDHRDWSPARRDRSSYSRERSPYSRERSPYSREKSPYGRSRQYDHGYNRSPSHTDRSSPDRARYREPKDRASNYLERSPLDRGRSNTYQETSRKSDSSEKHGCQSDDRVLPDEISQRDPNLRDSNSSAKEPQGSVDNNNVSVEIIARCGVHTEEQGKSPSVKCKESSQFDGACEEPSSMEEDMDICDTPPHVPLVTDSSTGKWFYLDYSGVECGPSKLCDLKALVEEGALMSDHFIKHLDSDRWVTVEKAVSPMATLNFPSIVPDSITQLVSPPEAPGNELADTGDVGKSIIQTGKPGKAGTENDEGTAVTLPLPVMGPNDIGAASEPIEDLHIDERVAALLDDLTVIPGRELETIGEALWMTVVQGEALEKSKGCSWQRVDFTKQFEQKIDEEILESVSVAVHVQDSSSLYLESSEWFYGWWSCKGGDWKRNEDAPQDIPLRKKLVLNDGFPLCKMPKSAYEEDPRWHCKDDLYYPSQSRRLDLPSWAFSCPDERSDCDETGRVIPNKLPLVRCVKGAMLPVIRINACVVKDHGSFVSEPRMKVRAKDRYPPARSSGTPSSTSDAKRPLAEAESREKASGNKGLKGYQKFITTIDIPKDRVHTFDYLQLHLGDWYYYDGAGYEHGPSSYSELQLLVDQGVIQNQSNVFRKFDRVWVPVTSATESSEANRKIQPSSSLSEVTENNYLSKFSMLHNLHTQFIGYTREKIHELVMKSYKSREFAAAINQVLDPWISTKQPKKEMEKNTYWKSDDVHATKRARMSVDESEGDHEMGEALHADQKDEPTFDDLCGETTFQRECNAGSESQMGSWGLLDGHVLARVFHCLRSDMKSVVYASSTCKHWRAAARFYRHISRQVDMSFLGSNCTDSLILNIMDYYSKEKVNSMVLAGCTNISPFVLEEIIGIFPSLSSIDITGCSQLGELACKYPNMNWVKSRSSSVTKSFEEAYSKVRSLKQVTEKSLSTSTSKGLGSDKDDFGELKEYFESVAKRDSANQLFRRSLYKRSKLFDARRSSSIVSRDARTRRWAIKKSEDCYKRMQEFLASGLKEIMKENTFEFFGPKVAEIQDRMKNGYYIGHGINSVKEDIRRMCRDAIKAKNKREPGDLNHFVFLFKELASRLEGNFKSSLEQDEMKSWEDDIRFASATGSKYRKKHNKMANERKYKIWFNGTSTASVGLSRQKKKTLDSGSESNDFDGSSEDDKSDSQSTVSDAESDLGSEARTVKSKGDGYFTTGGGFGSDDREWGARMTKASLVPPVTRKYETIEKYVLVADEEDVERKMRVSLPDDYGEKLNTVKNGTEELDMELPEVKDFKPRKLLGHEVLEQEVYGIDPYTHNLLLDSMPEELEWPLQDKHLFIEDVLLRTLNKQVSDFTGMRNTPMTYPLQRVIEEIERSAEEECDIRTMRICQGILKAIDSRPDDKYVGYRKGLGVVCNYVEGFGEDDFVVEFLGEVYPVWKWFEKQDGIRSLQKNSQEPAPEFYNIYLERPKGDAEGYDLVVVDAMHKANYASRICHSCRPNCEAKVTAVDGHYQIGIYTLRKIQYGEEITFDYNSVTESKEEYEASVCLCGSQVCRGSYLNLTGEGAFEKVLEEWHGVLDRYNLMLEACELNSVSEEDYLDLGRAGLGSCLLGSLPDWLVAYSARLVRFINFERTKLPEEILRHNLEEKRKYFSDILLEVEKSDAEVQAEGVYNQRLQNLAVTLDKVRYVMRCIFEDPKKAPPPLKKLSPEDTISFLWQGEGSLVEELLHCLTPHLEEDMIKDLRTKIRAHNPSILDESQSELQQSLLWLRDEVRDLPCTHKSRNDAAADLIHIYAYTKCFFRTQEYKAITSPPVYISPLDLGPKCAAKLGPGLQEYSKTYGESYCLGQLIFWHNQTNAEPDCSLVSAIRGCLSLPDIGSFYAKVPKPSKHWVYGPRTVRFMLSRMEKQPQRPWPKDRIWSFKNSAKVFGSPMMDSILKNSPLEKEMVHWLKHRQTVFEAMWDQ